MDSDAQFTEAVGKLRGVFARAQKTNDVYKQIVAAQPEVLARYQQVFSPERIPSLTEEEFQGFLMFENNQHWWFPPWHGPRMCEDMDRLGEALAVLVDEDRPIEERLNRLLPKSGRPMVPYFNRALITAILLITQPDKYGVWNSTSEGSLKELGIFPDFDRGAPFSERYLAFNDVLKQLAEALGIDLWALDGLHWILKSQDIAEAEAEDERKRVSAVTPSEPGAVYFHLEKYLHQFMRDNWDSIDLGEEWTLYEEDGEPVGYQYKAGDIGYIDLLAHHQTEPRWLVIELKRAQSSDETLGQVLRYMGWAKRQLADSGDVVEGLIIAHSMDPKLQYALEFTTNVSVKLYEVDFRLKDADQGGQEARE